MLYDELLARPPNVPVDEGVEKIQAMFMAELRQAVRIKADNVASYLFMGTEQEEWDLTTDFPYPVPPFPVTWIEWIMPPKSNSGGSILRLDTAGLRWGVLLMTQDTSQFSFEDMTDKEKSSAAILMACLTDPTLGPEMRKKYGNRPPALSPHDQQELAAMFDDKLQLIREQGFPDKPRWTIVALLILQIPGVHGNQPTLVPHEVHFMLNQDGNVINIRPPGEERSAFISLPFSAEITEGLHSQFFFVPFLTLSFLNCKNVRRINVEPPAKLNKARVRRGKLPLVSHYTLEILPMQEILRQEGKSEELGLQRALHLCRGHFADYTQGKGLFGKHHGRFWISQHLRGTEQRGRIEKDYAISGPLTKNPT